MENVKTAQIITKSLMTRELVPLSHVLVMKSYLLMDSVFHAQIILEQIQQEENAFKLHAEIIKF